MMSMAIRFLLLQYCRLDLDLDPARPLSTPPPEATTDMTDITGNKQLEKCPCIASLAFEIQEGMMVMDAQKVILRVNPAFTRLTGFGGDEVIGQTPPQLSSGLQDEHFYQRLWQAIADEGYWQGEIRDRRKNGEVFPEWLTVSAILGLDGQIGHYVGSFVDMGAHKRREHDYQAQLQQKNAELALIKAELNEIHTALKVLSSRHAASTLETREILQQEINQAILPFLTQLKSGLQNSRQQALLDILQTNLQDILSSYGSKNSLSRLYQELTPKEIQIASMIRQGLSTKYIAATLSTTQDTINVHRKNIRKKLGLTNESVNLPCYLRSFE